MDATNFDQVTRALSSRLPRRAVAGLLGLGALGVTGLAHATSVNAGEHKHKHKQRRKKRKITTNAFGCVDVGKRCKQDGQCCSGTCADKQGKRTCQAHDAGTCQVGQDVCLSVVAPCTATSGAAGQCAITTGKASYCFVEGTCADCTRDTDCEGQFGAGAACIVCAECAGQSANATGCVGVNDI